MAANLVQRYPPEQARHLLNLSFAQFHADRDVVAVERELERRREQLATAHGRRRRIRPATCTSTGGCSPNSTRPAKRAQRPRGNRFDALRPGDVVHRRRGAGGKAVVLKQEPGRGGQRVLALTQGKSLVRLSPARLPRPGPQGRDASSCPGRSRRAARPSNARPSTRCGGSSVHEAELPADADREVEELQGVIAPIRCTTRPAPKRRCAAAWQADRIARDVARLERRVASRNESLARQFDRVLGVLEAWGYVDGWDLTDAGRAARPGSTPRATSSSRKRCARAISTDSTPPTLAALVSCFTFQRRGPDGNEPMPPRRWPNEQVAARGPARSTRSGATCTSPSAKRACPRPAGPIPASPPPIHAWVRGRRLADVLEDEEMTGGDFVRNVKQTIDLLRQIADVAPDPDDRRDARTRAADACLRGVDAPRRAPSTPSAA